jgi:hypothetical protein
MSAVTQDDRPASNEMQGLHLHQRALHRHHTHSLPRHLPHRPTIVTHKSLLIPIYAKRDASVQSLDSDELTAAAINRFEAVAAALITKLKENETNDNSALSQSGSVMLCSSLSRGVHAHRWWPGPGTDSDILDDFDVDAAERLAESIRVSELQPFTLASSPDAPYVPRKDRRQHLPVDALPKVAIVGRPNVGKSALFNRLAGSNVAVVYDYPGVTRDRLYTRAFWGDKEYVLIDTGAAASPMHTCLLQSQTMASRWTYFPPHTTACNGAPCTMLVAIMPAAAPS